MIKSSKLSVTIHDVEFAKDFQYTITVQYEGIKVKKFLFRNKQMYQHWLVILFSQIIHFSSILLQTTQSEETS